MCLDKGKGREQVDCEVNVRWRPLHEGKNIISNKIPQNEELKYWQRAYKMITVTVVVAI